MVITHTAAEKTSIGTFSSIRRRLFDLAEVLEPGGSWNLLRGQ